MAQREQRVTPLELFFDLVFVYAITQVTLLMSDDPTWEGLGRGLLVLAALWWAWTGYAWLTNTLEPEEGMVRAGMFGGMAAMLVAALAVPGAFGTDAVLFGVAYALVRLINLGLYGIAGRRDTEFRRTVLRFTPTATIGPLLILVAAFLDGAARTALWVIAIVALYSGPLIDRGRGWRISPMHFAERYGLVVVIAALWWAYFDVMAVLAAQQLSQTTGTTRARVARDVFSYLHMPMIVGIVLFALGLKITAHDGREPLALMPAVALCGGLSLYYVTHVVLRVRLVYVLRRTTTERPGWIGPGRLAAAIGTLAAIPITLVIPALAALALVAALCWALIVWDVRHYREHRVE